VVKDNTLRGLTGRGRRTTNDPFFSRPEVHEIYRGWRRILNGYDDRLAIGKVGTDNPDDLARYLRPDELHQVFQFDLQRAPWSAAAFQDVVTAALKAVSPAEAAPTWVLSSHDSIRHLTRYEQPDGIPGIELARAKAALLLLLALPGSAYLYQGEELGLPDVVDLPSGGGHSGLDGCRVPLPWSGKSEPFGFSFDGVRPWLPMPAGWASLTAEAQEGDPFSTLAFYRQALALRRHLVASLPDKLEWLNAPATALFFRRGSLTCALNCGENPVRLPPGRPLLTSIPPYGDLLPGNAAAWLVSP